MTTTRLGSTKFALFALVICVCITAVMAGAAVWQHSVSQSKLDEAAEHDSAATLFQQAEGEGQAAGQLLQQYVASGDATLIPQINDHTAAGVTKLTAAVQQSGIDGKPFLDGGTALVQAEGQIIAVRQSGDVQTAVAGLTQLTAQFQAFVASQNTVITQEQNTAATARDDADQASTAQAWMIVGCAIFAMGSIVSGVLFVRRTASRRRSLNALPSA